MFPDTHPHAGGAQHYPAYLAYLAYGYGYGYGYEVELVADDT